MLYITHKDDGKENFQSHEIEVFSDIYERYMGNNMWYTINPLNNIGYGETKEEAYESFKKSFFASLDNLNAFGKMLEMDAIEIRET